MRLCRLMSGLLVGIACLVFCSIASGGQGLTLDECIRLALEQNPLIQSVHQQYEASLARVYQAAAFPQPSVAFDSDQQPRLFNFRGSGESYFGITQTVEFPGKRLFRGKIAEQESAELLSDNDLLKLTVAFQVKQAFYTLLLAKEKLRYAKQNLGLAQDFLKKAEFKHGAGDVAKVEVLRARVEALKAANEVKTVANEESLAKAMLNFLLARKKFEALEIKGTLKKLLIPMELDELIQKAFSFRPEVKKVNISLEKEAYRKKQGYLSYFPDFELGLSRHRLEGEKTTWDFTLSFPIPLFFWQPKKGKIAETEAFIESLEKELEHLKNSISLEVEEAYRNALTAASQIQLFEEELLAQAEEVYNMYLFSYQEGEIGGIELIEARRTLIEARRSYADALYNYDVTLAALEKSVGQTLEGETDDQTNVSIRSFNFHRYL